MRALARLSPLLLIVAAIIVAWASGAAHWLSWQALARHHAAWHAWTGLHPVLGAVAYVAIYVVVVALSLPAGGVLTLTGGLLFGPVLGAALAVGGAAGGAVLLFLWVRGALGAALATRARPLVERLRPGLERDGFAYLLALRLFPAVPFWLSNLAPAVLGMRLAPYALATVLGIIPATAVLAGVGAGIGDVLARGERPDATILLTPAVLLPLAGLAALALLPVAWRRWRGRHA